MAFPVGTSGMSQPRILQLASGDLWGGAEAAVYELCRGLSDRGMAVRAVVLNPGELASRLTATGIPTMVLDERSQSSLRIFVELRRVTAVFRPQVIHSHRKKEHILACAVARTVLGARPALVKTIHGAPEPRSGPPRLSSRVSQALDVWCDRQFAARVAVSSELAGLLRGQTRGASLEIVHNGIRPPPDAIRDKAVTTTRVVGFAGRFVPIKRIDLLIQIAAIVRQLASDTVHFQIVGGGPLQQQLLEQARSAGVADTVSFVPFQPNIWNTLASWDVAILTSDHEGLPMICLEALAAGLPVFARNVGGLREVVLGPEQGALLDSADPEKMAVALLEFIASPSATGPRRSRLPADFSADAMCAGYTGVYGRLGAVGR